jgi:HPt (histidine-containing phosphotransfer) domain-containing protein
MKKVLGYILLPAQISPFEEQYLARLNRLTLGFFALHVPVFTLIAWCNGTGAALAALMTLVACAGPALAYSTFQNPRWVSVVNGIASMVLGGILVHFGQGPIQIEMHFYFFALIAMLAVYGNPLVIVAAAVTVAGHHAALWALLPRSVFNYDAPYWVVGVHALFVVLESVAACFISRSFFDNVIELERVVHARTKELDLRNQEMRLVLDSIDEGLATIDRTGVLSTVKSAAFDRWFGVREGAATLFDALATKAPRFAANSKLAWEEVTSGFMPMELTLDQMPKSLVLEDRVLRIEYRPIGEPEKAESFMVVVTDVTTKEASARAEQERQELAVVFEALNSDKVAFLEFYDEAVQLLKQVDVATPASVARPLHTLKGNLGVAGLHSIAALCHQLEDELAEVGSISETSRERLRDRFGRLMAILNKVTGGAQRSIEVKQKQYLELLEALRQGASHPRLIEQVSAWQMEPMQHRLAQFGERAQQIASRLAKDPLDVQVDGHGVVFDPKRWSPLWSALIHGIRNAIDHGIESPDERQRLGKKPQGQLRLECTREGEAVVLELKSCR